MLSDSQTTALRALVGGVLLTLLILLAPARASAEPSFAQLTGTAGCIAQTPPFSADCEDARGIDTASSVAISPNGDYAYIAAPIVNTGSDTFDNNADAITIYSRNTSTGALTQLPGTAGCVSEGGTAVDGSACADGRGMDGVRDIVVSPDGEHVYAVGGTEDGTDTSGNVLTGGAVAAFDRNPANGQITQLAGTAGCISDDGEGGQCVTGTAIDGGIGIDISPNGENVYVASRASDAITVLSRKPETGQLSQTALGGTNGCISDNGTGGVCANGRALNGAASVVVSPDGRSVYATSLFNDAIVVLRRNETTGVLTQPAGTVGCIQETGLDGCFDGSRVDAARDVTVSPDSKQVYVVAETSDALTVYSRNITPGSPSYGDLTKLASPTGCHRNAGGSGCTIAKLLNFPTGVAVSPDGTNVYVTAAENSDGVAVFDRNTSSGVLTQLPETAACVSETGSGGICVDGKRLDGAIRPSVSPNIGGQASNVYVPALQGDAVAIFKRLPDGDIDGTSNATDNCPGIVNFDQANSDGAGDGGDACDTNDDNDAQLDTGDNCRTVPNSDQLNTDGDAQGNACDADDDNDGVPDGDDNCALDQNPDQVDTDEDKKGDVCDPDDDDDNIDDNAPDNCPLIHNPLQTDSDGDGLGNECDGPDPDGDGIPNTPPNPDNCPTVRNPNQLDTDGDGEGNTCDADDDNDNDLDGPDNCNLVVNPDQENNDGDGAGDACDADDDNDADLDTADNCVFVANADQANNDPDPNGDACDADDDNDLVEDVEDNCQLVANAGQANTDDTGDGGDACDPDDDNDSALDGADNCQLIPNADQANADGAPDGGDACDPDDDNDTVADSVPDNCRLAFNPGQENADGSPDGGDACDGDADDDGIANAQDNCATTPNADQANTDGAADGGDSCDPDNDNDGLTDDVDLCGLVASSQADLDADGVGDVCDLDVDGDGVPEGADNCAGVPNADQADADGSDGGDACDADDDNDGVADVVEVTQRTSPLDLDSDDDGLADQLEKRTSPRLADSDKDRVQDGTENGVTKPIADPAGPVGGTDPKKFKKDKDPKTKTKPTKPDSDGDKLKDGSEDRNRDGRFDRRRETNPLKKDTDGDGVNDRKDRFPRSRARH